MIFYGESITVGATAVGIGSTAKVPDLKEGFFTIEGGDVRYWLDGSTPTASVGHLVTDGSSFSVMGNNNLRRLLMISTTGTVTVRGSYEK